VSGVVAHFNEVSEGLGTRRDGVVAHQKGVRVSEVAASWWLSEEVGPASSWVNSVLVASARLRHLLRGEVRSDVLKQSTTCLKSKRLSDL
jgi:hypothetical protein